MSIKDDQGYAMTNNTIYPLLQTKLMAQGLLDLSSSINIDGKLRAALVDNNYIARAGNLTFRTTGVTGSVSSSWIAANGDMAITGGILNETCTGSISGWPTNKCGSGYPWTYVGDQYLSSSDGQTVFGAVTHGTNLTHLVFYLDSGSTPGTDYLVGHFSYDKDSNPIDITTDGGDITFNWQYALGIFKWQKQ